MGAHVVKSTTYQASRLAEIDKYLYDNNGDAQGATTVIRRMPFTVSKISRPKNPTRVLSIRYTAPENIPAGTVIAVPAPSNLYDCTTWADYFPAEEYDYVGYYNSYFSQQQETKTVLAQAGSTATQNFAFDCMDDID